MKALSILCLVVLMVVTTEAFAFHQPFIFRRYSSFRPPVITPSYNIFRSFRPAYSNVSPYYSAYNPDFSNYSPYYSRYSPSYYRHSPSLSVYQPYVNYHAPQYHISASLPSYSYGGGKGYGDYGGYGGGMNLFGYGGYGGGEGGFFPG